MAYLWNVVSNSEGLLILERGSERLVIVKPEDPLTQQMFIKIVAGSTVSDIGVYMFTHPKKPPTSVEGIDEGSIPHIA
jgi:hypothetical protein